MAKPTSRRSRSTRRRAEPLLLLACCLPFPGPAAPAVPAPAAAAAPDAEQLLYLEVELNQQATGQLLPFVSRDGRLFATPATLAQLDFHLPDAPPDQLLALDQLPGVQLRYDAAMQRLAITAPLSLLKLEPTVISTAREPFVPATNSPGLLLNYDL